MKKDDFKKADITNVRIDDVAWQAASNCRVLIDPLTNAPATAARRIELFFPKKAEQPEPVVVHACENCHVMLECRAWSIAHQPYGYSGGLTEGQRVKIRIELEDARKARAAGRSEIAAGHVFNCPNSYRQHKRLGYDVKPIEDGGCGCLEQHRIVTRAAKLRAKQRRAGSTN